MDEEYIIFKLLLAIFLAWMIYKLISSFFKKKRRFLSDKLQSIADRKFYNSVNRFKKRHNRIPNRNEKFRIAIQVSHYIIKRRDVKGHWIRQKIRKHLLEKNKVVEKFTMR